ncbi:hypothetical protein CC80DRAFT_520522 [Byssothecium circinans]|uniref:Uncharacterized protein n=1 Tax=Byssothecium circinans TaxID=147558 RepID=A0A6A5TAY6_9PLEO|nr:hypothetical protein CC80DRAFT_520522 [Byssothecium circinans]
MYSDKQSEESNTASRSVKPGLIASGIVLAWTWAATMLQSSTVMLPGPFWYAAGATVQILMFSILACKVKQNASRCHAYLEIIYARYGFDSQLLLGGSAVLTALTGMNVYAAIFLIPTGVCTYVILGGLRTLIIMIIILYFMFHASATSPLIGSPGAMYDLLKQAATTRPIDGSNNGSYLNLKSNTGPIFGVIQLCSGSGTVFLDQAYWQRAIASRPTTAVRAYIVSGLAWFAIPILFPTTLGLAAAALAENLRFPTYPNKPTSTEIYGAVALLIMLFMAATSCASAELIAVSSLLTFDVYKTYIQPKATPNIDLGWLFLVMGPSIGGAVFSAAFSITWMKQSRLGAVSGCVVGLAAGIIAWLTVTKQYYDVVTVATTGQEYLKLAGNLAAIMTVLIVTVAVSLIRPDKFDWEVTRSINAILVTQGRKSAPSSESPKPTLTPTPAITSETEQALRIEFGAENEPSKLRSAFKLACIASFVLTFIMDCLIPMPMFFSQYIFSKGFFTAWVVISFLWVFGSTFVSCFLPIWETRSFFGELVGRIGRDAFRRTR